MFHKYLKTAKKWITTFQTEDIALHSLTKYHLATEIAQCRIPNFKTPYLYAGLLYVQLFTLLRRTSCTLSHFNLLAPIFVRHFPAKYVTKLRNKKA